MTSTLVITLPDEDTTSRYKSLVVTTFSDYETCHVNVFFVTNKATVEIVISKFKPG